MPRDLDPRLTLLALAALAAGCGRSVHQQYDHGRAYMAVLQAQSDLSRPSAADAAYALTGKEGIALRERATESATDQESGEAEATKKIQVQ
jgi:hypothetical protein